MQKSEPATEADMQVVQDFLDTLKSNQDRCVGMAANMIGVKKNIIVVTAGAFMFAMINAKRSKEKMSYLIKDTTKQERIELIRSWVPDDEVMDGCDIDLWEMYRDYINGKREIAEINASFSEGFYEESDLK